MLRVRILLILSWIVFFLKNWRHFDFYEHFIKKFHIRKVKCLVRGGCQFGGWNQVTTEVIAKNVKPVCYELIQSEESNLNYCHEPCACLCVPCSSRLQPIVSWIHLHHTRIDVSFARWNFLSPAAKENVNIAKSIVSLKQIIRKASSALHKSIFSLKSRLPKL